jgi:hypothetical protein
VPAPLQDVAFALAPEFSTVAWGKTWEQPLSTGKALEWALTASLIHTLRERGWVVSFPILDEQRGPAQFCLRNELPLQHGNQPGNAGAHTGEIELVDRFSQAFLPKVICRKGDRSVSVFREGCPYHLLLANELYSERPDILFVEGEPTPGFPTVDPALNKLDFSYAWRAEQVSGSVRIVNAAKPPLMERDPPAGAALECVGMVESTIGKSTRTAVRQLTRYEALFRPAAAIERLPALVVSSRQIDLAGRWPVSLVDVEAHSDEALRASLCTSASEALNIFGLR